MGSVDSNEGCWHKIGAFVLLLVDVSKDPHGRTNGNGHRYPEDRLGEIRVCNKQMAHSKSN